MQSVQHQAPRFDIYGRPSRPYTVNSELVEPPKHWLHSSQVKTRSELLLKRKKEFLPDITYDVDGDGYVDHKDMAIAKMFDRNQDGKLDDQEKADLKKAFDEGTMDKYVWGLDNTGSTQHPRLVQKFGKIFSENALGPARTSEPVTYRKIKEQQKLKDKNQAEELIESWVSKHPNHFTIGEKRVMSEPLFKTFAEKKSKEKKDARDKIGLADPTDVKDVKEVKYLYVENPPVSGFSEFKAERKQKKLDELHNGKNYDHVTREKNFLIRENGYIHIIPENSNFMTSNKLKEIRRQEINHDNMKKFVNTSIGIHGTELPKYSDNLKEYWKISERWNDNPMFATQKQLLDSREFRKKSEITQRIGHENTSAGFRRKKTFVEVTEKPGQKDFSQKFCAVYSDGEFMGVQNSTDYRMSTVFGYFMNTRNSQTDTAEPVTTSRKEIKNNVIIKPISEAQSPRATNGFSTKTKTFIKKQGHSHRTIRSRGFIH